MPFATFASGPYTATYNVDAAPGDPPGKGLGPRSLGLVEGVRRWQRTLQALPVRASAFGPTHIDGVYGGAQSFCEMTLKEWTTAVRDVLWPFGAEFGRAGLVGRLLSDLAGELVLTAVPHTPAAGAGPATITFGKAILAPDFEVDIPLGPVERDVPVRFRCLPYVNGQGEVVWFEQT